MKDEESNMPPELEGEDGKASDYGPAGYRECRASAHGAAVGFGPGFALGASGKSGK